VLHPKTHNNFCDVLECPNAQCISTTCSYSYYPIANLEEGRHVFFPCQVRVSGFLPRLDPNTSQRECQKTCQNRCQIEWQEIIPYIFPDDMSETMTNKCQGGDHLKKSVFFAGTSGFKPRNMGVLTCFN
jgi:hypothetical protein